MSSSAQPLTRRKFLETAGLVGLAGTIGSCALWGQESVGTIELPFENGSRPLVKYPEKRALIRLTSRPPQLETPFAVFNDSLLTPNDAFFVRYHLPNIPTEVDSEQFRLDVKGEVKRALRLSLAELRAGFEPFEIVAVNECSGNSRGFSRPRVAGGQLGHGAMGNARWRGVRLKDVLQKAEVAPGARQISFNGMDNAPVEKTPDFVKALDIDHALDGEVMLAYEMNGERLPMLNGYPLRLVVPGYYGTYWVKHLNEITVLAEPFTGFWMSSAYRIPDNDCACVAPGTVPHSTVPIGRLNVRSFITSLANGSIVAAGREIRVRGIAFDGGHGIGQVLFSGDGGRTWTEANLGEDLGKYSFREWSCSFKPTQTGAAELKVKATNRIGQSQPSEPLWNPAGYMRNVVESLGITVSA